MNGDAYGAAALFNGDGVRPGGTIVNDGTGNYTDTSAYLHTARLYNQNGSTLDNIGSGASIINQNGAILGNYGGYRIAGPGLNFAANTTGTSTTLINGNGAAITNATGGQLQNFYGAVIQNIGPDSTISNGDQNGSGTLFNGSNNPIALPGGTIVNDGTGNYTDTGGYLHTARLYNQNGSTLDNIGLGASIINKNGAILGNYGGYRDSSGSYFSATTGGTTNFYNQNGATLTNTSGSQLENFGGAVLTNSGPDSLIANGDATGSGSLSNGGTFFNGQTVAGGVIVNDGTGSYTDASGFQHTARLYNQNGSTLSNVGSGASITNQNGAILGNYGGYRDSSGSYFSATTGSTTNFYNQNGATLTNTSGSQLENFGGAVLTNSGPDSLIANGDATGSGSLSNGGTFFNGQTVAGGVIVNDGTGSYTDASGFLHTARLYNQNSSTLYNVGSGASITNQNGAVIFNDASSTVFNQNGAIISNAALFINNGAINNAATFNVTNAGSFTGTGSYVQTTGGTTQVDGSFTQSSLTIAGGSFTQTGTTTITGNTSNSGTVLVKSGVFTTQGTFDNNNAVTINNGATLNAGTYTQGAGSTTLNNGTLDPAGINISGGTFGGLGTVVGNVSVTGGIFDVGSGLLTINGNYTQTGGSLLFEVVKNSNGFDIGTLTANAFALGGNLDFSLTGASAADLLALKTDLTSHSWDLFSGASGPISFSSIDLTSTLAGVGGLTLSPNVIDLANGMQQLQGGSVSAVPLPASFPLFASSVAVLAWLGRRRPASLAV